MDFAARRKRTAVGKGVIAGIVIVIVIIAAVGIYYATTNNQTTASSSSSSSTSSSGSTSSSTTTLPSSSSSSSSGSSSTSSSSSSSSSSLSSSSSSSASSSSSSSSSSTTATGPTVNSLVIDDIFWPIGGLNQLNSPAAIPFPNWLTNTVYQPLLTLNATALQKTGAIQYLGVLADNWTISPDQRTYTFHLRNVKFSDGNPVNSYQVWGEMYGLYYLTANSSNWWLDYPVFNMTTANFGPSTLALMKQSGLTNPNQQLLSIMQDKTWPIYVTDSSHIVYHLQAGFSYFLGTFTVFQGLIFDTQYVLDNGGFGTPAQLNTAFNLKPIPGSGPYIVTDVSFNAFVKFQQDPNYWGRSLSAAEIKGNPYIDPGHVKNVLVQVKSDDVARYADLSGGTAQVATILDQNWPLVLSSPDKYAYISVPPASMLIVGIGMNVLRYPTNITAVREAISYAVNYTDISVKAFGGTLNPWNGPEYPAFTDFYNLGGGPVWPYNLSKAQQILKDNNIDTSKFPTLEFRVLTGCSFCINTAQVVQADLAQIGININIEVTPSASYGPPLIAGPTSFAAEAAYNATASQLVWLGSFTFAPGADTPADPWLGWVNGHTPANNWAIYTNPVVQKCVDAWTAGVDITTLKQLCTAAQLQINHDTPYIWLGSLKLVVGSGSVVWDKRVISNAYIDPVYSGQSDTVIFNTVTFTNGQ